MPSAAVPSAPPAPVRRPIARLAAALVNRIAAGEIIERPASVVKELIENAIDAGASSITVEITDGGRGLIRVVDDGAGIPAAELPLAFAQHATSKLATDADLFAIATMGFRGEALASIGAVSHARIQSRTADAQAAHEIINDGGAVSPVQAAAGNVGTIVEVRDLFFNVPARRKFLKGQATEFGHVADAILRTALAHPAVHFNLIHNDRVAADYPAAAGVQRWLAAWPTEFHDQRLPIDARDAEIRLHGIVGLPDLARPQAKYQFLYVNGRPVRDKFIQHALREAYRGLTEPGRHPAAVLTIEIPPADVDVNVHPTKSEVRFRDGTRIHGLVLSAVREKLLGSDLSPRATATGPGQIIDRPDMRQRLADFFRDGAGPIGNVGPSVSPPMGTPASVAPNLSRPGSSWGSGHFLPELPRAAAIPAPVPSPGNPGESQSEGISSPPASPATAPPAPSFLAIQLHNTYLVAEAEDGLVIIDQHALHERIMFEELLARVTRGPLESQRLLIPCTFAATATHIAVLDQLSDLLSRLGIEASAFGPESIAVQAFPTFLERIEPDDLMRQILDRSEQELIQLGQEELLHGVLDMMACKAAIKAGDALTPAEITALLARRELVERSSNCPHGRPTTLRISLHDLEKQFKRTGF